MYIQRTFSSFAYTKQEHLMMTRLNHRQIGLHLALLPPLQTRIIVDNVRTTTTSHKHLLCLIIIINIFNRITCHSTLFIIQRNKNERN